MVSTRRTETSGPVADSMSGLSGRHRRRLPANSDTCSSSSDLEASQEEDQWKTHQAPHRKPKSSSLRVRELRNRFVCNVGLSAYSTRRRTQEVAIRDCQRLEKRSYPPSPPPRQIMPEDSDSNFLIERDHESDEIFSPFRRGSRKRVARQPERRDVNRRERYLRPLKNQSYAEYQHSSMHSDSENDNRHDAVRRSTRQRKLQYNSFNTSWITDAQMVRGYPNLRTEFLSDQDSRHSQENGLRENSHSLKSRHHKNVKKNMNYLYEYEANEVRTRRFRGRRNLDDSLPNGLEDNKENEDQDEDDEVEETEQITIKKKELIKKEPQNDNSSETISEENKKENSEEKENDNKVAKKEEFIRETRQRGLRTQENIENHKDEEGSESENENEHEHEHVHEIRRQRKRRTTLNYMDDPRFSPRRTRRSNKLSDSSEEDIRSRRYKYQLRQRKPKETPISIDAISHRRRRGRMRQDSSSDNSDDDDDMSKVRKAIKTPRHKRRRGGSSSDSDKNDGKQLKSGQSSGPPMPIGPETLDAKVRFSSVGGLDNHVRCLREMVVLPMMYPEVFQQFQIQPPRGVLFHGPPGTGKTLIARALANECNFGSRKVSFFMRKGADLLSKWVGESEKQLRLLFEQAAQMKPSIIFFDELDGLAPVRSSRQDQIHASIVSTLLALMDGLDNRGEVIVIGATNRIDAIDPALRRPGRFDRELYFPLPARKEREEILRVHVSQWSEPPNDNLISHLAEHSAGYCGSDLRALCSEAVIQGLRRTYPQVYTTDYRLQLDPKQVQVEKTDFLRARSLLIPASHRVTQSLGRKLPKVLEPLLRKPLNTVLGLFKETFPHGLDPSLASVKVSVQGGMQRAQLLLTGDTHAQGQSTYLAPALLFHMEHVNTFTLDLASLYKESHRTPEVACVDIFNEARRNIPSVIYVPSIEQWWSLVGDTVRAIFLSQLSQLDPSIPILFLATANVEYKELPESIMSVFSTYRKEVLHLSPPVTAQRESFFRPLIVNLSLKPPKPVKQRPKTPPPLPRAKTPPPRPLSETELKKIHDKEEHTLRELRIFLRDMCKKLASNKTFYMFTKPVDLEEVPDYLTIIKQPMDLESMMTKVDLHRYSCAQEFLADIDLICSNALEYNPAKTPADKLIRHRACALRDYAYAMIKAEMDSDFEEQCRTISKKRRERKTSTSQFLPEFIHTPDQTIALEDDLNENQDEEQKGEGDNENLIQKNDSHSRISPHRKRKSMWSRGFVGGRKRKKVSRTEYQQDEEYKNSPAATKSSSGDESKENKPELNELSPDGQKSVSKKQQNDLTTPLNVKCSPDVTKTSKSNQNSPSKLNETLSPAIWPTYADLIEDTPQVEDTEDELDAQSEKVEVLINKNELENCLTLAVNVTKGCSLLSLLDLYGQLHRVILKYSRTNERNNLPQELQREVNRFNETQKRPSSSRHASSS